MNANYRLLMLRKPLIAAAVLALVLTYPLSADAQDLPNQAALSSGGATFYNTNPFGLPGARGEAVDASDGTATTYQVKQADSFKATAATDRIDTQTGWIGLLGLIGCFGLLSRSKLS